MLKSNVAMAGAMLAAIALSNTAYAEDQSTVLLMEPDAKIRFITTGTNEIRADWSEKATENLQNSAQELLADDGKTVVKFDATVEQDEELEQLLLLYNAVAQSVGIVMPHKGKKPFSNKDLTLGPSVKILAEQYEADEALFIDHYSQIESGGVFMTQVMIGAATGYTPASQNLRITSGNLVDLETGRILETGNAAMGDARNPTEAKNIVKRLFKKMDAEEK